jgi:hypothetical protein
MQLGEIRFLVLVFPCSHYAIREAMGLEGNSVATFKLAHYPRARYADAGQTARSPLAGNQVLGDYFGSSALIAGSNSSIGFFP